MSDRGANWLSMWGDQRPNNALALAGMPPASDVASPIFRNTPSPIDGQPMYLGQAPTFRGVADNVLAQYIGTAPRGVGVNTVLGFTENPARLGPPMSAGMTLRQQPAAHSVNPPNATPYGSGESALDWYGPGETPMMGHNAPPSGPNSITGVARPGRPSTGGLRDAAALPEDVPFGAAPDRSRGTVIRHEPARGDSARFADFQTRIGSEPQLLTDIVATARQGEEVGRPWYNTEGTRQRFIATLGEEQGHRAWQEFMERMGAASPGQAVYPNIRHASYYHTMGPEEIAAREAHHAETGKWPRPTAPYGSQTQQYQGDLDRLVRRGEFMDNVDPTTAPKPRGFANSLMGNTENIAADKHFMRYIGMSSGDPRFLHGGAPVGAEFAEQVLAAHPEAAPYIRLREVKSASGDRTMQHFFNAQAAVRENGGAQGPLFRTIRDKAQVWDDVPRDNEYGAYERLAGDIARRMDMTPAQLQASLWMGAAQRTGVRADSQATFDQIFGKVLGDRAAERGLTSDEVFRQFALRQRPLAVPLAVGGAAAATGGE